MSTRATYLFQATDHAPSVCFYIHYDGYPDGAACYFRNMIACDNARGGMPARFIRANDLAEFTARHEAHGDTEYRYTLSGDHLVAEHITSSKIVGFFAGPVYEFVNKYRGEGVEKVIPVRVQYAQQWMLESDAIAAVEKQRKYGLEYACQWGEGGNTSGTLDNFQRAAEELAATLGPEHPVSERLLMQVHTLKDIRAAVASYTRDLLSGKTNAEIDAMAAEAGWDSESRQMGISFLTARMYRQELSIE